MGGPGSGRHWGGGGPTTEDYRSLDVRWLKREGLLAPGMQRRITWSRQGEVTASIEIAAETERLWLRYRHRVDGGEWEDEAYPVRLARTACAMGGGRPWFLCPAQGCGRRVAILYGSAIFACRHCLHLPYPSQREKGHDRAARRADRIREKLDWPGGILEGSGWGKPKGMHRRTYERLCREHDVLAQRALQGVAAQLGLAGAVDLDDPTALLRADRP